MRRPIKKTRVVKPDRKYNSVKVTKLINKIMEEGKKSLARSIVYVALEKIDKEVKEKDPVTVLDEALNNVGPLMELRSRRVGGANYQIPTEVSPDRRLALAIRWIIQVAKNKKGSTMSDRLAQEIILASKNEGEAVTRRENTHKMAEANRAFAYLGW